MFHHMSHITRTLSSGFPTSSNTNRAVQPQMAGGLKYSGFLRSRGTVLCSQNKRADQLYGNCAAA